LIGCDNGEAQAVAQDWTVASIDAMDVAAVRAREPMAAVVESLDRARTACSQEVPVRGFLDELIESSARGARHLAGQAIERYARAVPVFRSHLVMQVIEYEA
jgi:hypothetical protein